MRMHIARRLSEAVGSWLHFEFCCYRAGLFSESSLKAAVGHVLSSFPSVSSACRVHADFPHAALNPVKRAGRKREVDFALVMAAEGLPKYGAEILVETKWAGSSHCTPINIFHDFLRLAILKAAEPDAKCIFLLAGTHKEINNVLAAMPFQSGGKKNTAITASGNEKRITFDHTDHAHRKWFKGALIDFADDGFTPPSSFVTRATDVHPLQTDGGTVDFQCIAWEVVSVSPSFCRLEFWQ